MDRWPGRPTALQRRGCCGGQQACAHHLGHARPQVVLSCDQKHFQQSDAPLLVRYCENVVLARRAAAALTAEGAVIGGRPNPWLGCGGEVRSGAGGAEHAAADQPAGEDAARGIGAEGTAGEPL
jgi:hypothetical protein